MPDPDTSGPSAGSAAPPERPPAVASALGAGEDRRGTPRGPRRWPVLIAAAGLLAAAVLLPRFVGLVVDAPPRLELRSRGRLVVLPFTYEGGGGLHGWVGQGLMEMTARVLGSTRGIDTVPPEDLRGAIAERALDPASEISRARIRQLGLALGAEVALEATADLDDALYTLDYRLYDAEGEMAAASIAGPDLFALASKMAASVAEALDPDAVAPSFRRTFSSSGFLNRLYAMGLEERQRAGAESARPYFEICLRSDERFLAARLRLAECERSLGRLEASSALYVEVLEEAEGLGERHLQAESLLALGELAALDGRYAEAGELLEQAGTLYRSLGDTSGALRCLYRRARLALTDGDEARAEALFFELLQGQVDVGDRLGEAESLLQLGTLALARGEAETAESLFERARQLARRLDDVRAEMRTLASLGEAASRRGDPARAAELWREALAFYRQRGERRHQKLLLRKLGEVELARGDLEGAEDSFLELLTLAEESDDGPEQGLASLRLAWILLRQGYPYQAREHLERALRYDRQIGESVALGRAIAWLAYEEGNLRLAVETQRAAKEQAGEAWDEEAERFLEVYERAVEAGRRLALPTDDLPAPRFPPP